MTYGPPKIRRMVTDYLYDVELGLWVDFDQNKTLEDFYIANMALPFDWKDFGILPNPDATYTFKAPPSPAPLGGLHWVVRLSLTMETYG